MVPRKNVKKSTSTQPSRSTRASAAKKRKAASEPREDSTNPSKRQRKSPNLTEQRAVISTAVGAALLPCLDLLEPLMEFTRACSKIQAGSPRQAFIDERERRVHAVLHRLRVQFTSPPVLESLEGSRNEHGEAEAVDSEVDEEEEEEEEVEEEVEEKAVRKVERKVAGKGTRRPGKRKTELAKLGLVQEEPRPRRTSRATTSAKALNRGDDGADEKSAEENADAGVRVGRP